MYPHSQRESAAPTPKEATLNDRLNKAADSLAFQCDRIESVLARVNGTPPTPGNKDAGVAQIRPTHALVQVVEHLETLNQRLAGLAANAENIA